MNKIVELLREHGIPYREHGTSPHVTPNFVGIECPYCGKGTGKFGMGISLDGRVATCWRCGVHRVWQLLHELGVPYDKIKTEFPAGSRPKEGTPRARKVTLPEGIGPMAESHKRYLRGRGFDPDELGRLWSLAGVEISTEMSWRIIIPVFLDGVLVSWTSRTLSDTLDNRYRNAKPSQETVSIHNLLYGWDYVRNAVIVHEGCADVWRTGPGSVATFGVKFTPAQVDRLSRVPRRVVCYDADAQGQAHKLCNELGVFPGVTFRVRLESGKDSAEADADEVKELRKLAFGEE